MAIPQTIHTDRTRLSMPWLAWLTTLTAIGSVAAAVGAFKSEVSTNMKTAIIEIQGLRSEVKEISQEMKQAREVMHTHDVRISTLEEWKRLKTGKADASGY